MHRKQSQAITNIAQVTRL